MRVVYVFCCACEFGEYNVSEMQNHQNVFRIISSVLLFIQCLQTRVMHASHFIY